MKVLYIYFVELILTSEQARKSLSSEKSFKEKNRRLGDITNIETVRVERYNLQKDIFQKQSDRIENYFTNFIKEIKYINDYFSQVRNYLNLHSSF